MVQLIVPDPERNPISLGQVIDGLEGRQRNRDGRFGLDEAFHFGGKFHKQSSLWI